jgi:hypothetical protein
LRFDGACNEEPRISGDVLIEIIAAMALYGRNFILLVEEGVTLPANLQGLCECRYSFADECAGVLFGQFEPGLLSIAADQ